ncbi:MAG: hypothetical protein PUE91_07900 [Clostridiales bacterium]|nr:hypothetical protein [Clostridiales bacterium]
MKQKVYAAPSFYVFWAVFCLLDEEGVMPLFLFAAGIHELGHAAAIYFCGGRIDGICLCITGAVLKQGRCLGYGQECLIALAGPAAGLAAAWLFSAAGYPMMAGANLLLSVFNSLPILPLDGGCAVKSLICLLPSGAADTGQRLLALCSVAAATALTAFGAALLVYTGQNASALAAGGFLLFANMAFLRNPSKYGMMELNHTGCLSGSRWKQR